MVRNAETNGLLLTTEQSKFSKEPRPVYYKELDILGFDQYWTYPKDDSAPLLWAEANNYIYRGKIVARTKGGSLYTKPEIILVDDPEPDGAPLQFVDIVTMCKKNQFLMETLVHETIQNVYNKASIILKHILQICFIFSLHIIRSRDLHSGSDTSYPTKELRTY